VALFRRRSGSPAGEIAGFWDWWSSQGHELAEQSIDGVVEPQAFAQSMGARVSRLGKLGWELTAGETSEHVLVITAEGEPAARAVARRVVLAAPEADTTWSYVDSRPPAPEPEAVVLSGDGSPAVDFSQVQVTARLDGGRFDVLLHHPSFADLPEESRLQITFMALDAALGEVDTELWLGEIQPVEFPPLDGFGLSALRSVVRDLKSQRLDEDGRPRWAMLRGETKEGPLVAMARSPLHALTAPNLDTYVAVVLPYLQRTDEGLPDEGSLEPLAAFERRLDRELGVSGQVVAQMSNAGVRTLHLYVDSAAGVLAKVKRLARSWDQGGATVHDMADPGWTAVSHLRV
jgi:Family of unknown function (DUF695)